MNDDENEKITETGPFMKDCETNVSVEETDIIRLHASEVKILFLKENDVE